MGHRFRRWVARSDAKPKNADQLLETLLANRSYDPIDKLVYGDYGLERAVEIFASAIESKKKIALYADYDVDGTMSCVSWIWFLRAIGYTNFVHYIPCRFKEGYGVNLGAVKKLIDEDGAQLVITMDTGITANEEAAYCRSRGVEFVCTDHHVIQPTKMPDCVVLNPKMHPDERYQEMCGCGITFVALRRLAERLKLDATMMRTVWTDLMALAAMATICDVVPLTAVNHRLARLGVEALRKSERPVLRKLRAAAGVGNVDESDVGFRLGPRINAVGRLEHADLVVKAFVDEDPDALVQAMGECNERRKKIQEGIVQEADVLAKASGNDPISFYGGEWHPGVVGIAASKIAERYWRPTWLFQRSGDKCKGSARSIPGFDVTEAMASIGDRFVKFGGHRAAGGFTFEASREAEVRDGLMAYAEDKRLRNPQMWESVAEYDCAFPPELFEMTTAESIAKLKPYGNGFTEPVFRVTGDVVRAEMLRDKATGVPKHTVLSVLLRPGKPPTRLLFFGETAPELQQWKSIDALAALSLSTFRGERRLELRGVDFTAP